MKTYAYYDKDGNIVKIISTTRTDLVSKNAKGMKWMKVDPSVNKTTHKIIDGESVKVGEVKEGGFIKWKPIFP
jgi:hypothetical protein